MKLAWLSNTYPMPSTTFIRGELAAIEALGQPVDRYAVRRWDGALPDPEDRREQARTRYILDGNRLGLIVAALALATARPWAFARALALAWAVWREAGGGIGGGAVRHVAYLLEAAWLARRLRADGVAHLHVHFATNSATVALLAEALGGPGWSLTVHGPDEFTDAPRLSFARKIAATRFAAAISDHGRSQILRWASFEQASKIHVVRCGLGLGGFSASDPPAARRLVCVGRLCPQKGQEMIPPVVAALKDEMPDLEVLLVGDGPSRPALERAIRAHGVTEQVRLLGWRDNAAVRALMRDSRALLLPSFAEGLPVVIMEAMALGRPVISTYIAGIPELLDDTCGWIVPAGSEAALAEAMRAALVAAPADLARMGREGRARVEARHHLPTEAGRLLALIEAAVGAAAVREGVDRKGTVRDGVVRDGSVRVEAIRDASGDREAAGPARPLSSGPVAPAAASFGVAATPFLSAVAAAPSASGAAAPSAARADTPSAAQTVPPVVWPAAPSTVGAPAPSAAARSGR